MMRHCIRCEDSTRMRINLNKNITQHREVIVLDRFIFPLPRNLVAPCIILT